MYCNNFWTLKFPTSNFQTLFISFRTNFGLKISDALLKHSLSKFTPTETRLITLKGHQKMIVDFVLRKVLQTHSDEKITQILSAVTYLKPCLSSLHKVNEEFQSYFKVFLLYCKSSGRIKTSASCSLSNLN